MTPCPDFFFAPVHAPVRIYSPEPPMWRTGLPVTNLVATTNRQQGTSMAENPISRAECSCGQLSLFCRGAPAKVSVCHCDACRRRTGSAFGISAFFRREEVTVTGQDKSFTRDADSGHSVTFHFCPDCGSTVYWEPSRKPDMIGVASGAFADPDMPMPDQSVCDGRRYPWVVFPDAMAKRAGA
jgi:hypothetical protein